MKHLISLLTALLCLCGGVRADTILINPYSLTTPAFPYLVSLDFEEAGVPVNWFNNSSPPTYPDYTTSPLIGAQSLQVNADGAYLTYIGTAIDHSEVFGKFRLRVDALPGSPGYAKLFTAPDASYNGVGELTVMSDGTLSFGANGNSVNTVDAITTGVSYWVYFRIRSGIGTAGQIAAGFSTTEVRPTSGTKYGYTAGNGGVTTTNIIGFGFSCSAGMTYVADNLQIAATIFD